jgi:hypothetical protein
MHVVYLSKVVQEFLWSGIPAYSSKKSIVPAHEWEESMRQLSEILKPKK